MEPDAAEVPRTLRAINRLRLEVRRAAAAAQRVDLALAETAIEKRFSPSHRLAVYGTLAPGEVNHHAVADLAGTWHPGFVRGVFAPEGWGTTYGFPALRWGPEGPAVPVQVLESPDLPDHWQRLDKFEGPGYRRILVPVEDEEGRVITVANLYEGLPSPED